MTRDQLVEILESIGTLLDLKGENPFKSRAYANAARTLETCAADGMCSTACPVKIDTGSLVKRLRAESHGAGARAIARWTARCSGWVELAARTLLRVAHVAAAVFGGILRPVTALVGALVLGVAEALVAGYSSASFQSAVALVLMLALMVWQASRRPVVEEAGA